MTEIHQKVGEWDVSHDAYLLAKLICPECGGTRFGSISHVDGRLERRCRGFINGETFCGFSWDSEDDAKYMYLPLDFVIAKTGQI